MLQKILLQFATHHTIAVIKIRLLYTFFEQKNQNQNCFQHNTWSKTSRCRTEIRNHYNTTYR